MCLGGFLLIVLVGQLGFAMRHPGLYELDLQETQKNCTEPQDPPIRNGCFISNLDDVYNYKCWVTSHDSCDARKYVGEGSLCEHTVTGVGNRCSEGKWETEENKSINHKRVRRFGHLICLFLGCGQSRTKEVPNKNPTIKCPSDVTTFASAGRTTTSVYYSQPTASDDQGTPSVSRIQGPASHSHFNEGSTVIRFRARDKHGATSECHFTVTVRVHYCRVLSNFAHGSRRCTGSKSNIYGSSCSHTCDTGYTLQGNSGVRCYLKNNRPSWTSFPTCTPVSCGSPRTFAGTGVQCTHGFIFSKTCNVVCNAGFRHSGAKLITCTNAGEWTQLAPCTDVQAPKFPKGCPASKTVFSGPLRAPTTLGWVDPVTTDNSGRRVTLTSYPVKWSRRGTGTHSVTMTAIDTAGNKAYCSFKINVQARECQPLANPANGKVSCSSDHAEGSVCTVSCNQGYRLQGQASIACLVTEKWNAETPTCQAVVCPEPPNVDRGQFTCLQGRQNPAKCTLTCISGYEVRGRRSVQCDLEGKWTTHGTCEDVDPPVFDNGCHGNTKVYAAALGQHTFVNLRAPTASDNSGDVIQVTSDVRSGSAFPLGMTIVTYTATDASGNRNSCYINVTVSALQCDTPDLQPNNAAGYSPMLKNCPDGYVHGASCTLNCTQGYRLQGRDTVTCERDDSTHPPTMRWKWSGTDAVKPTCQEDNCPPLSPPKNGALSCYKSHSAWDCFMSCSASWDVPSQTEDRFVCSNDLQSWIPDYVPDCVARTRPNRVKMLAEVLYFAGSCDISTEQLRHTFMSRINQTTFGGVCSRIPTCVAENIEVKCSPVSSGRRKRSEVDDALLIRFRRTRRDINRLTSHAVRVTFHVTMPYEEDSHTPEEAYKNYQEGAGNFIDQLRSQARSGFFNMDDLDLVTDETGLGDPVLHADCPPGTVYKVKQPQTRFSCVPK